MQVFGKEHFTQTSQQEALTNVHQIKQIQKKFTYNNEPTWELSLELVLGTGSTLNTVSRTGFILRQLNSKPVSVADHPSLVDDILELSFTDRNSLLVYNRSSIFEGSFDKYFSLI